MNPRPEHREGIIACGTERLREAGLKLTPQRATILELLADHGGHVTPQQIVSRLDGADAGLSQATVYNTLELFESLDLLRRMTTEDGQAYFDVNTEPHHHAICQSCGEIFDLRVPVKLLEALMTEASSYDEADQGFSIEVATLWFRGTCGGCRPTR